MPWPNDSYWKALDDGEKIDVGGETYTLAVVDCGELITPTGRIAVCDPFTCMEVAGNPALTISPGRYPVKVTLADVSGKMDASHIREAYASLLLKNGVEVRRGGLVLEKSRSLFEEGGEEFFCFPVDSGTACFVDEGALAYGMPDGAQWYEDIFDSGQPDDWFHRMDDPNHIRAGLANIPLPLAQDGANLILIHSGWGDGIFPVVGGYNEDGELTAIHIDFNVVSEPSGDSEA